MNKKIMSFVLAMVLSVSLGSSLYASYSGDYDPNAYYNAQNQQTVQQGTTTATGTWIKVGSKDDVLSGNLTAVFSYYGGIMTGYESKGGLFVITDSYGQRAVMSNAEGVFTVQSYNFRQSDIEGMPNILAYVQTDENGNPKKDKDGNYIFVNEEAEKAFVKAWEDYLKERGFSEEQLSCAVLDEEGKPKVDASGKIEQQPLSANFYALLKDYLCKGENYTATLSQGDGINGVSATVFVNGEKPEITFVTDYKVTGGSGAIASGVRVTGNYVYDDVTGLLIRSETYTLEQTELNTETGEAKYEWKKNISTSTYEKITAPDGTNYYLRTDKTYANKDLNFKIGGDSGDPTTVTTYSANGSRVSMFNNETKTTTYFVNSNNVSTVINDKGLEIARYQYTANYVQEAIRSVTGEDGEDGELAYETTVCDKWGIATGVLNGDYLGKVDLGRNLIQQFKDGIANGTIVSISSSSPVRQIYLFEKDLQGPGRDNFKKYFGWTDADISNMLNFSYGNGPVAIIGCNYNENFAAGENDVVADGATTSTTRTSGGTHKYNSTLSDSCKGWTFTSTILIGGTQAYQKVQTVITGRDLVIESDPAVEGTLFPEVTNEELVEAGIDPNDKEAVAAYKEKKIKDMAVDLGIGHLDEEGNLIIDDQEAYDNLKEGFYYDKETGKTYMLITASDVYLMDGSEEFQTVSGEVLLVDIGTQGKDAGKEKVKTIKDKIGNDNKIMFMGVVGEDKKGQLVLVMKEDWSGGYVTNTMDKDIEQVKQDIITISNAIYNFKQGTISEAEYNKIVSAINVKVKGPDGEEKGVYDWVITNSNINIGKFGGHYTWTDEGLSGAWRTLQDAVPMWF